ncbi:MAG: DEAD/DEAH box helicase [Deltaproteobacteria bacterium]|nr:DEAD/DEAH box helicase [Deltaproteobacteria bacterium]
MLRDLERASPWRVLPPYFGPEQSIELNRYVRLLAHATPLPLIELWSSQRDALPLALDRTNRGGVINLRTSGGKTRVAELAILQVLLADPDARILYLAPFRSLALEVEQTLSATFSRMGHNVSHLYGGSRVSSVDTELATDSSIMIATPEKTRALFRAAPELFENVKLVVVDEGHLIGADTRHVRNELFLDHLRALARATGARLLLLSAVLPNAKDLAEWVSGDAKAVATSSWKPSVERFGLLRWNGSRVRIDWQGEVASYNPSFVEAGALGFGRRRKPFPANKTEAVASTAVRLSSVGPVMIFTARAVSVPTLAEAVLLALGEEPAHHRWPSHEWRVFEAVCREELDPDAIELRAARAGVVCHSNRLTPQVRLAMEHLMRSTAPRIIVATTTLAQGVNVGISSVIVANPYISRETVDKRSFWNICGRAGRAFVDGEGKILYAIDDTRTRAQVRRDEALARAYFDAGTGDPVKSGLLFAVSALRQLAASAGVSFNLLLQLAAENDFSGLGSGAADCDAICDLLDDELLALHEDPSANAEDSAPVEWVENVFRGSLAALQARAPGSDVRPDDLLAFLTARANSALLRVSQGARKAVVSSGLPLRVALRAQEQLDVFRSIADAVDADGEESLLELAAAVRQLEAWARTQAPGIVESIPAIADLNRVRNGWLSGIGLRELGSSDELMSITRDFYGYQLPWIIHAASQQLRAADETDRADALSRIALLVELGVPTQLAARIFLAGVRSRAAAADLAAADFAFGATVAEIARQLRTRDTADELRPLVSEDAANWLDLLSDEAARARGTPPPSFPRFRVKSINAGAAELLHARTLADQVFLCSTDGHVRVAVKATKTLPFDQVANDPRFVFARDGDGWLLVVRDPRLENVEGGSGA